MKAETAGWHVLSDKEQEFLHSHGVSADTKIEFFVRKPMLLFWLSVLSVGFYDIYWFYRNWQLVRSATGGKWSVWVRTIFTVFYAWPLFKIMILQAKQRGFEKHYSAGRLALTYIFVTYVGSAISRLIHNNVAPLVVTVITLMISVGVLIVVQRASSHNNEAIGKQPETAARFVKGEKVAVSAGVLFLLLIIVGTFYTPPKPVKPAANQQQVNSAKQTVDNLTAQYNTCAADLNARRSGVDSTSQASVDAFNADYDKCEAVRQQQNKAADDYNALIGIKK